GDNPVTLYGEGYGPKIQKVGAKYRDDPSFVLFDVLRGKVWLQRESIEDVASQLGIETVPVVMRAPIDWATRRVASGQYSHWGDFLAEGLVGTPEVGVLDRCGNRIQVKIKHVDFYQQG